jgi:hypothetical protein
MVLSDAWHSNVKPGWIVELLFDDMELNELKNQIPPPQRRIGYAHLAAFRGVSIVRNVSGGGYPSGPAALSVSPGPSLSPSAKGGRSPSAEGGKSPGVEVVRTQKI